MKMKLASIEGSLVMIKKEWLNPGEREIPYLVTEDYGERVKIESLPEYETGSGLTKHLVEVVSKYMLRVIDNNIVHK